VFENLTYLLFQEWSIKIRHAFSIILLVGVLSPAKQVLPMHVRDQKSVNCMFLWPNLIWKN